MLVSIRQRSGFTPKCFRDTTTNQEEMHTLLCSRDTTTHLEEMQILNVLNTATNLEERHILNVLYAVVGPRPVFRLTAQPYDGVSRLFADGHLGWEHQRLLPTHHLAVRLLGVLAAEWRVSWAGKEREPSEFLGCIRSFYMLR